MYKNFLKCRSILLTSYFGKLEYIWKILLSSLFPKMKGYFIIKKRLSQKRVLFNKYTFSKYSFMISLLNYFIFLISHVRGNMWTSPGPSPRHLKIIDVVYLSSITSFLYNCQRCICQWRKVSTPSTLRSFAKLISFSGHNAVYLNMTLLSLVKIKIYLSQEYNVLLCPSGV